jgi:hypothetical protein
MTVRRTATASPGPIPFGRNRRESRAEISCSVPDVTAEKTKRIVKESGKYESQGIS